MKQDTSDPHTIAPSGGHLFPTAAWALAFGFAAGWGAFAKPGTVPGIAFGALVMGAIAGSFHLKPVIPDAFRSLLPGIPGTAPKTKPIEEKGVATA